MILVFWGYKGSHDKETLFGGRDEPRLCLLSTYLKSSKPIYNVINASDFLILKHYLKRHMFPLSFLVGLKFGE